MTDPEWAIIQYTTDTEPTERLGVLHGGDTLVAPDGVPDTSAQLLDEWERYEPRLRALIPGQLRKVPGARLSAPLTYPRKLICAGANYLDHVEEMGIAGLDAAGVEPFFFLKPPTTTIVGTDSTVQIPRVDAANLDWEVELGVVIADRCKNVAAADAMSHVAGYVIANDLSVRGLFARQRAIAPAFEWDWFSHKGPDGLCPIGPGIVPHWLVADPGSLDLRLEVNGAPKQQSNTANLLVGIPGLIAAASKYVTLEPGDVILTGTPAGVGMPRGDFLKAGDVVVAAIDGLGRLETRIA